MYRWLSFWRLVSLRRPFSVASPYCYTCGTICWVFRLRGFLNRQGLWSSLSLLQCIMMLRLNNFE